MTPFDTVKRNLSRLRKDTAHISEKTLYELSELSGIVYRKIGNRLHGEEAEMILRRGSTEVFFSEKLHEDVPKEYLRLLSAEDTLASSARVCAFSFFLAQRIRTEEGDFLPWTEKKTRRARIAYVPSGKAEEAYFALAPLRDDAAVLYATSTQDAVNALLSRDADYAMLPYLSASGERISGVDRLRAKHDLYLCARVGVLEMEEKLVYALFSTQAAPYAIAETMALSLQITADSFAHLGLMLSLIPAFGYEQMSLFTEAEEYGRVRAVIELIGKGDALALWIYLSLYSAGSSLLGRYPIIETKER